MRQRFFFIPLVLVFALFAASLHADVHVNAYFTADNVIEGFYLAGTTVNPITMQGVLSEWRIPKTASFDLPSSSIPQTYQLVFRIKNIEAEYLLYGDPWNAGGFLADLRLSGYRPPTTQNLTHGGSEGGWQWALDSGAMPLDFNMLTWTAATAWAYQPYGIGTSANNGGDNVWGYINGGPVPSISTAAEWIWGSKNGVDLGPHGNPDPQNFLWMRTSVTVQPVPEPSALILFAMGAIGLIAYSWRRRA